MDATPAALRQIDDPIASGMDAVAKAGENVASSRPAPARLLLRDVSKSWGERQVLDGVSLEVGRGEVIWLGGQNGAGKTTLLRIVAGLVAPDHGTVSLDGHDPSAQRSRYQRLLGFLPAGDRGLYARLTVAQNLSLWASLAFVPRGERDDAVEAAARLCGIGDLLESRADRLSTGQRQRVRLAMAFLHAPRLILLDEPTASLDDEGAGTVVRAIAQATARGAAVVWCSPRPPDPPAFDRGLVLVNGALRTPT
jgi:ABC-2 type transport system ATP-binding protein